MMLFSLVVENYHLSRSLEKLAASKMGKESVRWRKHTDPEEKALR